MEQNLLINILVIITTILLVTNILLGIVCLYTIGIYRKLQGLYLAILTGAKVDIQRSNK